jgi:hypothetical protein
MASEMMHVHDATERSHTALAVKTREGAHRNALLTVRLGVSARPRETEPRGQPDCRRQKPSGSSAITGAAPAMIRANRPCASGSIFVKKNRAVFTLAS